MFRFDLRKKMIRTASRWGTSPSYLHWIEALMEGAARDWNELLLIGMRQFDADFLAPVFRANFSG